MTGSFENITPLKDFSSVPVDKRFMLGHPRMMSTVVSSRTMNVISSVCRHLMRSFGEGKK